MGMYQQSVNSINSIQIAMNSQLNLAQFLPSNNPNYASLGFSSIGGGHGHMGKGQKLSSTNLSAAGGDNPYGLSGSIHHPNPALMSTGMQMINGNSINSINSIYLGGLDHNSLMIQNSALLKSNASGGSNGLGFADKLKQAYDK